MNITRLINRPILLFSSLLLFIVAIDVFADFSGKCLVIKHEDGYFANAMANYSSGAEPDSCIKYFRDYLKIGDDIPKVAQANYLIGVCFFRKAMENYSRS